MMLALLSTRCPASCFCSVLFCLSFCFVALRSGFVFYSLCLCWRCLVELSVMSWVCVGGSLCFSVTAAASNECVSIGGPCSILLCMHSLLVSWSVSVLCRLFFMFFDRECLAHGDPVCTCALRLRPLYPLQLIFLMIGGSITFLGSLLCSNASCLRNRFCFLDQPPSSSPWPTEQHRVNRVVIVAVVVTPWRENALFASAWMTLKPGWILRKHCADPKIHAFCIWRLTQRWSCAASRRSVIF